MDDLSNRFAYHAPSLEGVAEAHASVRRGCYELAIQFESLPDGREKSLALTKLEEAMFWANGAIARNQ